MDLIPAIDLLDGQCVRLLHGDFEQCQVYTDDTAGLAADYHAAGAEWLHVVDLAASRDGAAADTTALFTLLEAAPQRVQTGGGVRNTEDLALRLDAGADRVVVGSLCANDTPLFIDWLSSFGPDRLVAALDVRIGEDGVPWPRIHGWTEAAAMNLWELLDTLSTAGLRHALVTDISRDGALAGPNSALYRDIVARYPDLALQASGGVSTVQDLVTLRATGSAGAITGKALLEQRFTVQEALQALS